MIGLLARVGAFAPLVVFALAAAETSVFFGVVFPGELAVILGGVVAGMGRAPLWVMITAAISGAIVGDGIGFRLGRRFGPALRPRMAKISARIDAAADVVAARGWWALVVARFAAVLRAMTPFAAGLAGMPYRRFLLGNLVGGVIWGTVFTLVGYFAGVSYPRVERVMHQAGLALLGLAAVIGVLLWLRRRILHRHPDMMGEESGTPCRSSEWTR